MIEERGLDFGRNAVWVWSFRAGNSQSACRRGSDSTIRRRFRAM